MFPARLVTLLVLLFCSGSPTALQALETWATHFPKRDPAHYVFAAEKYGLATNDAKVHIHSVDPKKPINSIKEAWESAKKASGVKCRFHDLRHSACTRLIERGVPLPVVASLLGWSAGTTVRMAKRYGHISGEAQRDAVMRLIAPVPGSAKLNQSEVFGSGAGSRPGQTGPGRS